MNELSRNQKQKQEEKQETIVEETVMVEVINTEVNEGQVQTAVKEYAAKQGAEGKRTLEATLSARPVTFFNNVISVYIENDAQKLIFDDNKQDFLDAIRSMLKNNQLQLNVIENTEVAVKKAYTPNEKFAALSAKNPLLLELKKRLDLEVGM